MMTFEEHLQQLITLLQQERRITYRALKRRLNVEDDYLADLTAELIEAKRLAVDEDGKVLVWVGNAEKDKGEGITDQGGNAGQEGETAKWGNGEKEKASELSAAERRQLTVMFCDLVGSTALSARLDPEDYRAVVQQYQQTCAEVIQRHEGYLAQYLGDGLLVYFGYPTAHEDDARRAARAALEIITTLAKQVPSPVAGESSFSPSPFQGEGWGEGGAVAEGRVLIVEERRQSSSSPIPQSTISNPQSLRARLGIHTGLVVVGDIGTPGRTEQLALGETPNIAARIQGLAEPNTVIVSATTHRLIEGQFDSQPFGSHLVKGIDTPIAVYQVQSERQSASPLAGRTTLTPLVGREQEVGLLIDRWEQAKEGRGQVVLLSGEPGIGKSRLAYTLREHVTSEGSLLYEARCSPYHQHSAFYPLIDVLQRTLLLTRQDTEGEKAEKLERALALYNMQETLPLFASLLSLSVPHASLPAFSPQKQKERTLQALLQLLIAQAERQTTVSVWEDLHWVDPSSLEFLSLLIEQIPTTKLLLVLTFRPEFMPPWKPRSHISQLVLNRLGKKQVEAMIEKVAVNKALAADVIEQIRLKTDGVPLFVEELTKSVVETGGGQESGDGGQRGRLIGSLTIPATLQEALLARLDRLSDARQVAQLGATLGREFSHELLQAVTPLSEAELRVALAKLVEAEILYQRGVDSQARYFFKHALIQDTAYQSLLKSTRQQYHQQIAQVLEKQFPDTKETQPELLAHHYTEAGLAEQAILYWQQAGERTKTRSAYAEAIRHFTLGLELLQTQPDTLDRARLELALHIALGQAIMPVAGYAASETEKIYVRARELCRRVGETQDLFPVLWALWGVYFVRGSMAKARGLADEALHLAQISRDPLLLVEAHMTQAATLLHMGEFTLAYEHGNQGMSSYDAAQYQRYMNRYGEQDPGVLLLLYSAWALWLLGYSDQSLAKLSEALELARHLTHPFSLALAFVFTAILQQMRREVKIAQEMATTGIALSHEQGFPVWLAYGTIVQGWLIANGGQIEKGLTQIKKGIDTFQATGARLDVAYFLSLLAEGHAKKGATEQGLSFIAEALTNVSRSKDCYYEAELYRIKGELTLQLESKEQRAGSKRSKEFGVSSKKQKSENLNPQSQILNPDSQGEAEASFLKAIEIARKQQAKSWELRAATSLARFWQQQGKKAQAHRLLSEVYNWFTEGFDTKDLQEARTLLEELGME